MPRPTINSLTEENERLIAQYVALEKSFNNLSNGYAEGVKRITQQRADVEQARSEAYKANMRADEAERRLKKAERAAARYADANAKAIHMLDGVMSSSADEEGF